MVSTSAPSRPQGFSDTEMALLEKTADAMSAYSGKPVLAEIGTTDGVPWVVFGVPLATDAADEQDAEAVHWQMGGEGARWVGNAGGLAPAPDEVYDCRLLWAIQITDVAGERFLKLDEHSEVVDWSDDLADLLPFDIDPNEEIDPYDDAHDDEGEGDGGRDDSSRGPA